MTECKDCIILTAMNEHLRARIAQLEKELKTARERIRLLEYEYKDR